MTAPYHPMGSSVKKRSSRKDSVTVRMRSEDYEAYTQYCLKHQVTLSDGLNDFARAMMREDYARKVKGFIQWASLVPISKRSLAQKSRRETWHDVCELIHRVVPADPVHCSHCSNVFPTGEDGILEWEKITVHRGRVYCSIACAGSDTTTEADIELEKWRNLCKEEEARQEKLYREREIIFRRTLRKLIPESYLLYTQLDLMDIPEEEVDDDSVK